MLPSEVNITNIRDGVEFDRNGSSIKIRVYTFFVGDHGPFTEKFLAGEQDTPSVERRINAVVGQLREQGAIPQK